VSYKPYGLIISITFQRQAEDIMHNEKNDMAIIERFELMLANNELYFFDVGVRTHRRALF